MNTNRATWVLLEKKLTTWIKKSDQITTELAQISVDEMAECSIYDAQSMRERQELARKKVRKVYVGQPITVKFKMTNQLLTDVEVSNFRLVAEGVRYTATAQDFKFSKNESQFIQLQIVPEEVGDIKIVRVEWDLLKKFKCSFDFMLDKLLRDYEKIFQYKVAE